MRNLSRARGVCAQLEYSHAFGSLSRPASDDGRPTFQANTPHLLTIGQVIATRCAAVADRRFTIMMLVCFSAAQPAA